jgi:hypothetical protein
LLLAISQAEREVEITSNGRYTMRPRSKRFKVALSFPGEQRDFVEKVASLLGEELGTESVLYDKYYEAEFARPDLDTYLHRLYYSESALVAVFLCAEYERKEWCGLELRAVRDLIKRRETNSVMLLRFDATEISGVLSIDGYIWIGERDPGDVADLILQRYRAIEGGSVLIELESAKAVVRDRGSRRRRPQEVVDIRSDFMSRRLEAGDRALRFLIETGPEQVPEVVGWLPDWHQDLSVTHQRQLAHRFKRLFAAFPRKSAQLLADVVLSGDWIQGPRAAECFEYIREPEVVVEVSNRLGRELNDKPWNRLLDDPVTGRSTLLALGYVGALDWSYLFDRVLRETAKDPDEKYRSWSLRAAGLLTARQPADALASAVTLLEGLLECFASGTYGPRPRPVEDRELYLYLKRYLARRKTRLGADTLLRAMLGSQAYADRPTYQLRECMAYLLGELRFPPAVRALHDVALDAQEPNELRVQAIQALIRIRTREAASALCTVAEGMREGTLDRWPILGAIHLAHLTKDPIDTLDWAATRLGIGSELHGSAVIRAVGLCRAVKHRSSLLSGLDDADGEVRGHAALALARIAGARVCAELERRLDSVASPLEGMLLSLAVLSSGGIPDPQRMMGWMEESLFDWPANVVEDSVMLLEKAPPRYRRMALRWRALLTVEPANLRHLYG